MTILTEDCYRSLFGFCADGILVSDENGLVVSANPAFARLCGKQAAEICGRKLGEVIDCSCLDGTACGAAGLALSKTSSAESTSVHNATILAENGMELSLPVSHIAVEKGASVSGHLTVVYIIQTSSVQQAQTEFVSTVSHELRTPLTSIKGFADTILRAGDRLEEPQKLRYVGIIKDQADRLTRLVEDLLAVSRLESRSMQLTIRSIDLNEAVQRVCRNLVDKARNHRLVSKIPQGLPNVWADADRLEQILTNLIDNAIKYSPSGSEVVVSAREPGEPQEMVEFSVTDQGGGIPEASLADIFNKFTRLDNPLSRQTEGTGLGLYITRSLVLALGGKITVTSQSGTTTFTVVLPQATLEKQAARGRG